MHLPHGRKAAFACAAALDESASTERGLFGHGLLVMWIRRHEACLVLSLRLVPHELQIVKGARLVFGERRGGWHRRLLWRRRLGGPVLRPVVRQSLVWLVVFMHDVFVVLVSLHASCWYMHGSRADR